MDFVTIQSAGTAIDFGNLLTSIQATDGCSDLTRGVFGGGEDSPTSINTIQFFTIPTQSNATEFGDAYDSSGNRYNSSGISNSIRGLVAAGVAGQWHGDM